MKLLICIDVQNDFIDGSLGVDKNHEIADKIIAYAEHVAHKEGLVYATRDEHDYNSYQYTLEGERLPVEHCIRHTDGCMLYDKLDNLVTSRFGKETFMSKDLGAAVEKLVNKVRFTEIEICGFCTSICVASNALFLRGLLPNKKITVLQNLCGDVDEESHKAALKVMKNCMIDVEDAKIPTPV